MTDINARKFAQILVDYSTAVKPGDRVAIRSSTNAEPVIRALFQRVLEREAYPHLVLELPDHYDLMFAHASDDLLSYTPEFHRIAFEEFDVLIKVKAYDNTRSLSHIDPTRSALLEGVEAKFIKAQMKRGASKNLRWMSTIYPTHAYAMEAEMSLTDYQDLFYRACHADDGTADPVAYWQSVKRDQAQFIEWISGRDKVQLRGPNVDLSLSIKDRSFVNACGEHNLPDGEIYTGPVENSANGWVRYSYPAIYQGRIVEGVELSFEDGRVVKASAKKNEEYLLATLDKDAGARYIGEFAIGTNFEINRFTGSILLDEKIGGSFHIALGAGYPETGSVNQSAIHWDMICDMRQDSEIIVDGEVCYRNGEFTY